MEHIPVFSLCNYFPHLHKYYTLLFKVSTYNKEYVINYVSSRIKGTDEAKKIFIRYEELIEKINEFKRKYFYDWTLTVSKIIEETTNNMILARQGSDLVLNFHPMVSSNILYRLEC